MSKGADQRRKERREQGLPPVGPDHPRLESRHKDPNTLVALGPAIPARWSVPDILAARLRAAGRPIPAPVEGYLLIDTGASHLCISQDAAQDLNLRPIRIDRSYGAHGENEHEVFEAEITTTFLTAKGIALEMSRTAQVAGIPRLNEMWARRQGQMRVSGAVVPLRLIGLLGRDFLRMTKLTYDGASGHVVLQIDPRFTGPLPKSP